MCLFKEKEHWILDITGYCVVGAGWKGSET